MWKRSWLKAGNRELEYMLRENGDNRQSSPMNRKAIPLLLALDGTAIQSHLSPAICRTVDRSRWMQSRWAVCLDTRRRVHLGERCAERDYAYRLSAETAAAGNPLRVEEIARGLRQSQWFEGELDRQKSTLSSYCLSKNLVTNAEYLEFVEDTGHRFPGFQQRIIKLKDFWSIHIAKWKSFYGKKESIRKGKAPIPVVLVSYDDAVAYAQWRSDRDGGNYRLPSEEEWEKRRGGKMGGIPLGK